MAFGMKKLFNGVLFLLISVSSFGQTPEWKVGMFHFFDNTEFLYSNYTSDQTMAGMRLQPEVGFHFENNHQIWVGLDALKTYGDKKFIDEVSSTASYQFKDKHTSFQMGRFAKGHLLDDYSRAFFQDSFMYYRPNITGFHIQWKGSGCSVSTFLDWTGKIDSTAHEAFLIGVSAKYKKNWFVSEVQATMFHYAGSLSQPGVRENALLHPSVGIETGKIGFIDALDCRAGLLLGMERNRLQSMDMFYRSGLLFELNAVWNRLNLKTSSYLGEGIMKDYATMGSRLYWGDPFYQGESYHRLDLNYSFLKSKFVQAHAGFSTHFSENRVYAEQTLLVRVNLQSKGLRNGKK